MTRVVAVSATLMAMLAAGEWGWAPGSWHSPGDGWSWSRNRRIGRTDQTCDAARGRGLSRGGRLGVTNQRRNLEQALAERFDRGREWPLDIVYRETSTRGRLRTEAIFDRTARP